MATQIQFPDEEQEAENVPEVVDELLAKEMLRLDMKERTAVQEEVHGVNCVLPEETPETVSKALNQLAYELDKIPAIEKQAYLRSQKLEGSYVQTDSFRMRFLRASNFDVPWVAKRIVTFLELVSDIIGDVALQRPVCLSDFSDRELVCLRMGRWQFLPFADRIGRRIMVCFLDEIWEAFPPKTKAKISLYLSWTAGNDAMTQRRGLVLIVWFDKKFKIPRRPHREYKDHAMHSTRVSAFHMCTPDTPFYRFRAAVAKMRVGRVRRSLQTHVGNSMENRYALQSYGIPVEQMPISYTGKIKLKCIEQWVDARIAMEGSKDNPIQNKVIEYPDPDDVVFRPGSSCNTHSGNNAFRNFLISKLNEQEMKSKGQFNIRRKAVVAEVKSEVRDKNGGRFLIWNDKGWWNELVDEKKISLKIEYQIKELRKSIRYQAPVSLKADTSIFRVTKSKDHSLPFDLKQEIDEDQLAEAASCVAQCFSMNVVPAGAF